MPVDRTGWSHRPLDTGTGNPAGEQTGSGPRRNAVANLATNAAEGDFDPFAAYLSQLGTGSRRTMREALTKLADWASDGRCGPHELQWHLLGIEETAALRTRLTSSLAPATANKHLAALRGVLKQCWRHGRMSAEAYQRAIDLSPARGASPRKAVRLGARELRRIAGVCRNDAGPAGARDEALLALLYAANLRRSEAVALDLEDYDLAQGQLTVSNSASGKRRRFAANEDARRALERWIVIRGAERGPLFNPINKGGRIEKRRLSEQAIYIACQKRASEAGLPPTSPEDLRRAETSADSMATHPNVEISESPVAGFHPAGLI